MLSVPDRDDVLAGNAPFSNAWCAARMRSRGCSEAITGRRFPRSTLAVNAFEHLGRGVGVEGPDAAGSGMTEEADCGDRSSVRATVTMRPEGARALCQERSSLPTRSMIASNDPTVFAVADVRSRTVSAPSAATVSAVRALGSL